MSSGCIGKKGQHVVSCMGSAKKNESGGQAGDCCESVRTEHGGIGDAFRTYNPGPLAFEMVLQSERSTTEPSHGQRRNECANTRRYLLHALERDYVSAIDCAQL